MNGVTKIWVLASAAALIAVLAGGWFVGVQPQLDAASTAADATTAVDAQNQATTVKIAALSKAAARSDTLVAEDAVLQKAVPTILKPNTFVRRVNELSALDGLKVLAVSFSDSVSYTAPVVGDATLALGKQEPSISGANFDAIPVSVQVKGAADSILQFSHDIQNDERVFAINNLVGTVDDSGVTTTTLSGYIYALKR